MPVSYGSFARNQQDSASDIDVLVVGNPKGHALAEEMRKWRAKRVPRQFL